MKLGLPLIALILPFAVSAQVTPRCSLQPGAFDKALQTELDTLAKKLVETTERARDEISNASDRKPGRIFFDAFDQVQTDFQAVRWSYAAFMEAYRPGQSCFVSGAELAYADREASQLFERFDASVVRFIDQFEFPDDPSTTQSKLRAGLLKAEHKFVRTP
jgi:hypothetical protein